MPLSQELLDSVITLSTKQVNLIEHMHDSKKRRNLGQLINWRGFNLERLKLFSEGSNLYLKYVQGEIHPVSIFISNWDKTPFVLQPINQDLYVIGNVIKELNLPNIIGIRMTYPVLSERDEDDEQIIKFFFNPNCTLIDIVKTVSEIQDVLNELRNKFNYDFGSNFGAIEIKSDAPMVDVYIQFIKLINELEPNSSKANELINKLTQDDLKLFNTFLADEKFDLNQFLHEEIDISRLEIFLNLLAPYFDTRLERLSPENNVFIENYNLLLGIRYYLIGATEESLVNLFTSFTQEKITNAANELIAQQLMGLSFNDSTSIEERHARYFLLAYYSKNDTSSIEFKTAVMGLNHEEGKVTVEDMQINENEFQERVTNILNLFNASDIQTKILQAQNLILSRIQAVNNNIQHKENKRPVALLDVDHTLYFPGADSPLNTELLTSLKQSGIKDVYLFTDMRSRKTDIQDRLNLISRLEELGFLVHGVLTPPDLVWDKITSSDALTLDTMLAAKEQSERENNPKYKLAWHGQQFEGIIQQLGQTDLPFLTNLNTYLPNECRMGACFAESVSGYREIERQTDETPLPNNLFERSTFAKVFADRLVERKGYVHTKAEMLNLFIHNMPTWVRSIVVADDSSRVIESINQYKEHNVTPVPITTIHVKNSSLGQEYYDVNLIRETILTQIDTHINNLKSSRFNPLLSNASLKITGLEQLKDDILTALENISLNEIIENWENKFVQSNTNSGSTMAFIMAEHRNVFFSRYRNEKTNTQNFIDELKTICGENDSFQQNSELS